MTPSTTPYKKLLGMGFLALILSASYELARPPAESLFIKNYGADSFPYAWLTLMPAIGLSVALYNRLAVKTALLKIMALACLGFAASLVALLLLVEAEVYGAVFALYVWKDVYFVVLLETFWALANSTFGFDTGKKYYGLFCVCGSLGGLLSNQGVSLLAGEHGTMASFWVLAPFLVITAVYSLLMGLKIGFETQNAPQKSTAKQSGLLEGLQVLKNSRYLLLLAALIGVVQIVINLIDYTFQSTTAVTYPDDAARTVYISQVYSWINGGALVLQLVSGFIIHVLGVPKTLLLVPCLLGVSLAAYLAVPSVHLLSIAKVASKALDYSIFRAAKELLYIPLSYAEKTRGKAVIDVMTYRSAKAAASLIVLALAALTIQRIEIVIAITLLFVLAWLFITVRIGRGYQKTKDAGNKAVSE